MIKRLNSLYDLLPNTSVKYTQPNTSESQGIAEDIFSGYIVENNLICSVKNTINDRGIIYLI